MRARQRCSQYPTYRILSLQRQHETARDSTVRIAFPRDHSLSTTQIIRCDKADVANVASLTGVPSINKSHKNLRFFILFSANFRIFECICEKNPIARRLNPCLSSEPTNHAQPLSQSVASP